MPILGLIGGLVIAFVVASWASVRLVLYALQSQDQRVYDYASTVWQMFALVASLLVLVELWGGLAFWATGTWHWLGTLL